MGLIVGAVTPGCSGVYYFGQVAPGAGLPNANSAFRIGSVTKVFTTTLLSMLANLGVVHVPPCPGSPPTIPPPPPPTSLQSALDHYSPGTFHLGGWRSGITLEELADHHSGLPRKPTRNVNGINDLFASLGEGGASVNNSDSTASVWAGDCPSQVSCPGVTLDPSKASCGLPSSCFAFAPPAGAPFLYSNYAHGVLGQVLAHAYLNMTWIDAVDSWVLEPLGMSHTFVDGQTPTATREPAFTGCNSGCTLDSGNGFEPFPSTANPAGGLWSTGPDMLIFLRYIMGLDDQGAYLETPAVLELAQCGRASDGSGRVGLGWSVNSHDSDTLISKGGSYGGFESLIGHLKNAGVGLFVMGDSHESVKSTFDDLLDHI
jgi:CubicO group peptidase (beta-lactamase class C family)